jgi:extracellular factor (EF) 3-hydroxypalmitic acid methyl ester biosynthesis protein
MAPIMSESLSPTTAALAPGLLAFIGELVARGGPTEAEYPLLDSLMLRLTGLSEAELDEIRKAFGPALSTSESMQGFAYLKPHGYAGDFEIIDRIYCERISTDPQLAAWDRYFHNQVAPKAVRNRKNYFHSLLTQLAAKRDRVAVLNIASGPGRCMAEWLAANPEYPITFDCVELDSTAIGHARDLTARFSDRVNFTHQNALRFTPNKTYDLVWAAGICDYFSDPIFVRLLRRLIPAVAPAGELVAGNFSDANTSRAYMEVGEWRLRHRTSEQLRKIASEAGVDPSKVRVGAEPHGVNLFLHIASQ